MISCKCLGRTFFHSGNSGLVNRRYVLREAGKYALQFFFLLVTAATGSAELSSGLTVGEITPLISPVCPDTRPGPAQ